VNQAFKSFIATSKNENQLSNSFEDFMFITRVLLNSELHEDQDTFISISEEIISLLMQELANKCFEHRITTTIIKLKQYDMFAYTTKSCYNSLSFLGIIINTGVAKRLITGLG
jgi:hypothetical protein